MPVLMMGGDGVDSLVPAGPHDAPDGDRTVLSDNMNAVDPGEPPDGSVDSKGTHAEVKVGEFCVGGGWLSSELFLVATKKKHPE